MSQKNRGGFLPSNRIQIQMNEHYEIEFVLQLLSLNFINVMKKQTGLYQVVPVFSCFIISGGVNFEEKRCLFLLRENKVNNKNVINVIQWFEFDWGENDELEWELEWGGKYTLDQAEQYSWNTKYVQLEYQICSAETANLFSWNCSIVTVQLEQFSSQKK